MNTSSVIEPISWAPSKHWDGVDGNWSTFDVRVGPYEAAQVVRVLPSITGNALYVVTEEGCLSNEHDNVTSASCADSRGGLFNISNSPSWNNIGNYSIGTEMGLGYSDNIATYGLDTVALGVSDTVGSFPIDGQVVGAFATDDYYVGLFGLNLLSWNFSEYSNSTYIPSLLTSMKDNDMIPSLSWGYTAGAIYRTDNRFGSLTIGGYDSSRLISNDVTFPLASDVSRDLMVGLQTITLQYVNGSETPLLPEPILIFIDSTVPHFYLPTTACKEFETAFGLVWNTTYQSYFVDDNLHQRLLAENGTVIFRLGVFETGGYTVEISLPYASFDLVIEYPLVPSNVSGMRYFPLLRAPNDSQYTLGRAFLQEAYVLTNYEQNIFSVYQSKFSEDAPSNIVAINSTTSIAKTTHISQPEKIGIAVGATLFFIMCLLATVLVVRQRRKAGNRHKLHRSTAPADQPDTANIPPTQEIATNSLINPHRELPETGIVEILDASTPSGSGQTIPEMRDPLAPMAHELTTHPTSQESPLAQKHEAQNKVAIFVSTNISRMSWTSSDTSTDPHVETIISSQNPNRIDTDRSLPPTPISESLQISPIIANFNQRVASRNCSDALLERSAVVKSICGNIGHVPSSPRLNAWQRALAHLSYASMDMEIIIPPGASDEYIVKPLNIHKVNVKRRPNFF